MALHRKFRPYNIFGTHFKIFTDHYSLQFVPEIKQVTIGTDAVLVVVKSQHKNDFDIMYRKKG